MASFREQEKLLASSTLSEKARDGSFSSARQRVVGADLRHRLWPHRSKRMRLGPANTSRRPQAPQGNCGVILKPRSLSDQRRSSRPRASTMRGVVESRRSLRASIGQGTVAFSRRRCGAVPQFAMSDPGLLAQSGDQCPSRSARRRRQRRRSS